jgi:hypothetical protein
VLEVLVAWEARQEDCKFEASLSNTDNTVRPCLQIKKGKSVYFFVAGCGKSWKACGKAFIFSAKHVLRMTEQVAAMIGTTLSL